MRSMLLHLIATTSADVAATSSRIAKVERIVACLRAAAPEEVAVAVAYLSGELPQGTVGVGWARCGTCLHPRTSRHSRFSRSTRPYRVCNPSQARARRRRGATSLEVLYARATAPEQRLLTGLFLGELRQGALEGVMADAVAKAAGLPPADVRRAAMLAGDLRSVAEISMREGSIGLARFRLTPLRPLGPMLAQTAADIPAGLARLESAYVEWKLDGARIQVHRAGDDIAIFTRNLADITDRVPEIVSAVRELAVSAIVLDGEAIALRADGRPHPFQVTMSRFGTKAVAASSRPLAPFFFDCLHVDGDDLIDPRRASGSPRSTRDSRGARRSSPRDDRRGGRAGVSRRRARARSRGRHGQVAGGAVRGRAPWRRLVEGEARARSTSSCSPPSGGTVAGRASSRTSISARGIRQAAS